MTISYEDRLGDAEAGGAIFDAVTGIVPDMASLMTRLGVPRNSPMWIEVVWKLSEAGIVLAYTDGRPGERTPV